MHRFLALIALVAATLLAAPARAQLPPPRPIWHFAEGSTLPNQGFFEFLTIQNPNPDSFGQRFTAQLSLEDLSCILDGTLSASIHMSATGKCNGTSRVIIEGQVHHENEFGNRIPFAFAGRMTLNDIGGSQSGHLVLLYGGGGLTEIVAGHWEGEAADEDGNRFEVSADFRAGARGESGYGNITIGDSVFDFFYDLIPPSDDSSPTGIAFVGGGNDGVLLATGEFTPATDDSPAMLKGDIKVIPLDGRGHHHAQMSGFRVDFTMFPA